MQYRFTGTVHKEGDLYVSHCKELDAATSARTLDDVMRRTLELIEIHLEEAEQDGTLDDLLRRLEPLEAVADAGCREWRQIPYLLNLIVAEQRNLQLHGKAASA